MRTIKDRNGMDLTEAEDIKKRWQEYTEKLYKKDLHDPDNHDGVTTHLEPDILEREVKGKGEMEGYTQLNAECQRIARRDKKAFLSEQCNEMEENNRMEPHSSTLAWKIPWTEKPGRLQSMGSQRVRHD